MKKRVYISVIALALLALAASALAWPPVSFFMLGGAKPSVGGAAPFYTYYINYACRFDSASNAYLTRTPGVAGSTTKGTLRFRFKPSMLSDYYLFFAGDVASTYTSVEYNYAALGGQLLLRQYDSAAGYTILSAPSEILRDPSAWYDVVVAWDYTQATHAAAFYWSINGVEVTSYSRSTYTAGQTSAFGAATTHYIGRESSGSYANCLLAEVVYVDGQKLTADYFGAFNIYGVWLSKLYSGTFGTTGYWLNFALAAVGALGADLGKDVSGTGNHWTTSGLAAGDRVVDTPTRNFASLNYVEPTGVVYSEAALKFTTALDGTWRSTRAGFFVSSGKWYWETKLTAPVITRALVGVGLGTSSLYNYVGAGANDYGYYASNGQRYNNAAGSAYAAAAASGDVIMTAFDRDNLKIWTGINGTWALGGDPAAGTSPMYTVNAGTYAPMFTVYDATTYLQVNFGQDTMNVVSGVTDISGYGTFEYTPPTGFKALATANLTDRAAFTTYSACGAGDEDGQVDYVGNGNANGPFVYVGGRPADICIDGTHYDDASTAFDFLSNGVKLRDAATKNTNSTSYTLRYWLETPYVNDFKYDNAQVN